MWKTNALIVYRVRHNTAYLIESSLYQLRNRSHLSGDLNYVLTRKYFLKPMEILCEDENENIKILTQICPLQIAWASDQHHSC